MKLGEIARRLGCTLEGDPEVEIAGLAPIDDAGPGTLTFLANERYRSRLKDTRASAVIVGPDVAVPGAAALRSAEPYLAFVRALDLFFTPYAPPPGIHPTAAIAPSAKLGERIAIGAYAVIGERAAIGDDGRIDAGVVIYPDVTIGDRFVAHARVVVRERVRIGNDVKLQAGAVIGGDGFGYTPDETGRVRPIPQSGTVVLEDEVEVGANATIDRATVGATRVRRGAKIDNLVMIGHGSDVGSFAFLAGQTGLAGSSRIGAGAQLGGQVGISGHLTVGDGSRLAAQSGVTNDVPPGADYAGYPAVEVHAWRRMMVSLLRLPDLLRRVRAIEAKLGIGGRSGEE
jgi:UDP-3-O-[3-hydroxymyristoyl] glucosamine N-acyltransferase